MTPPNATLYCPVIQRDGARPTTEQLANVYAPALFFHPLEQFTMSSVPSTFANLGTAGTIMLKQAPINEYTIDDNGRIQKAISDRESTVVSTTLNQTLLLGTARNITSAPYQDNFFLQHELNAAYVQGSGFDAHNQSTAPIYYNTVQHGDGSVLINYYFYYHYHGCGDMAVVLHSNKTIYSHSFELRPFGEHQGDWQIMSVLVCGSSTTMLPLTVTYQQYKGRQITDCTKGECNLLQGTLHPVAFVAKNTHAMYPLPVSNMFYTSFKFDYVATIKGFYGLDRADFKDRDGHYRWFNPATQSSVVELKNPALIKTSVDSVGLVPSDDQLWLGFAGEWGGPDLFDFPDVSYVAPLANSFRPKDPKCTDWQTAAGLDRCTLPDSVYKAMMDMLGFGKMTNEVSRPQEVPLSTLYRSILEFFGNTGVAPRGPATRAEFSGWLPPMNAPIQATMGNFTGAEFCSNVLKTFDSNVGNPEGFAVFSLREIFFGVLVFCALLVILNVIMHALPIGPFELQAHPHSHFGDNDEVMPAVSELYAYIDRPVILYSAAFVALSIGMIMYIVGAVSVAQLVKDSSKIWSTQVTESDGNTYGTLGIICSVFAILVIVVDLLMLGLIWVTLKSLRRRINRKYDCVARHLQTPLEEEMQDPSAVPKKASCIGNGWRTTFEIVRVCLYPSLLFVIIAVLIGCVFVGIAVVIQDACQVTVISNGNICLHLFPWDIAIPCGEAFHSVCLNVGSPFPAVTVWGAVIMLTAKYFLIQSACNASTIFQNVATGIALLSSAEESEEKLKIIGSNGELEEGAEGGVANENEGVHELETTAFVGDQVMEGFQEKALHDAKPRIDLGVDGLEPAIPSIQESGEFDAAKLDSEGSRLLNAVNSEAQEEPSASIAEVDNRTDDFYEEVLGEEELIDEEVMDETFEYDDEEIIEEDDDELIDEEVFNENDEELQSDDSATEASARMS
jgi:hypothetical protein